jgi:Uma2 family endonuclease
MVIVTSDVRLRHFTVRDYYRMAEAGILNEDDRVELIEGEIVEMPPIGSRHASVVDRILAALVPQLVDRSVTVRIQSPVRLGDLSEPVPDLALLNPRADHYQEGHPGPDDILLLVEVSHSTVRFDKETKVPLYARSGIPEVWVFDLVSSTVDVHRAPVGGAFTSSETIAAGAGRTIQCAGMRIAIDDLLT